MVLVADRPGLNVLPLLWRLLADPTNPDPAVVWDANDDPDPDLDAQVKRFPGAAVVREKPDGPAVPADTVVLPGADLSHLTFGTPTPLALFLDAQGTNACPAMVDGGDAWLPPYGEPPPDAVPLTSPAAPLGVWLAADGLWAAAGRLAVRFAEKPPELLVLPGSYETPAVSPTVGHAAAAQSAAADTALAATWEEFGAALDRSWLADHRTAPRDPARDLAYARARSLGAWGGRPTPAGLVIVAPLPLHEALCK